MTLAEQIRAVENRRTTLTVYDPDPDEALFDALAVRNAIVRYSRLPPGTPGFVTVTDDDGFVASIGLETLRELLAPAVRDPGEERDPALAALFEHLDDLVFSSLDRRQLLSAAREIEDRAYRVGAGTLRVGFQSLSAFRDQVEVYRLLGGETALDVHVYGRPDWTPPVIRNVTVHTEPAGEIGRYWFLAFDGDGDDEARCGLIAEEYSPGSFAGFWTYDPAIVDEMLSHLETTYGPP